MAAEHRNRKPPDQLTHSNAELAKLKAELQTVMEAAATAEAARAEAAPPAASNMAEAVGVSSARARVDRRPAHHAAKPCKTTAMGCFL